METKHIIALIVFMTLGSLGLLFTLLSQRVRDAALFFLVLGAVVMGRMDVNFLGEYWYRGTSRGIELTLVDIAAWGLLVATLLLPRHRGLGRWFWPAGLGLMALYLAYCAFSVVISEPKIFGVWELTKVLRGLLVFVAAALFIRTRRELMIVVLALGCAVGLEALYGVEQRILKGVHRVPGTLFHENSLSMYLCTVGPVLLAATLSDWPRWIRWFSGLACGLAAMTMVMTLSRAGIPIFGLVMFGTAFFCTTWRLTWRKVMIGAAACAGVALLLMTSWDALVMRFGQASLRDEFLKEDAVETRGVYWRLVFAIAEEEPYGVGLNNWSYAVSKTYGPQLGYLYHDYDVVRWDPDKDKADETNHAPPAHSLAVITWGELGLPGLCIFGLLWLRWFQVGASFLRGRLNPDAMHRLGIGFFFGTLGLFLQSTTEWTYRQTSIMFTFHVMMGALASLYDAKRFRRTRIQEEEFDEAGDIETEAAPVAVSAVRAQG
jgi:hypothetical protein